MLVVRTLALLLVTVPCLASDPVSMKIQVVDTSVTETQSNTGVSGYAGHSSTRCDNPVGYGNSSSSRPSTNCSNTGISAGAGHSADKSILQINVHAVLPDGTHVTLWCQTSLRHCSALSPGEYVADVKGNDAWIHLPKMDGSADKIKYRSIGGW
jgi:hypothetical protein